METESTFVRTNSVVMLYTETHIGLYISPVINPVYTELNDSVWYTESLDKIGLFKTWMFIVFIFDRI